MRTAALVLATGLVLLVGSQALAVTSSSDPLAEPSPRALAPPPGRAEPQRDPTQVVVTLAPQDERDRPIYVQRVQFSVTLPDSAPDVPLRLARFTAAGFSLSAPTTELPLVLSAAGSPTVLPVDVAVSDCATPFNQPTRIDVILESDGGYVEERARTTREVRLALHQLTENTCRRRG